MGTAGNDVYSAAVLRKKRLKYQTEILHRQNLNSSLIDQ